MGDWYLSIQYFLTALFHTASLQTFFMIFFPFVLLFELPFYVITIIYCIKGWLFMVSNADQASAYHPLVTIVVTAYSESYDEILMTVRSIDEQLYAGRIETIIMMDNALQNRQTSQNAKALAKRFNKPMRSFKVIEKLTRGGHASSMNLGLKLAKGEVVVMVDADTSLDNQAISRSTKHFQDPGVIAVSGAVRVRNLKESILTRLQAIEYMIGIQLGRFGLTELNVTNNISGAFGIFRTRFLRQMGGWLNGTAEDLDLTMRLHTYVTRYPQYRIVHEPFSVAWTAAPATIKGLFKQRVRWDGDLYYIHVRRHWRKFSKRGLGQFRLLFFVWFCLYYQIVLPFVVVLYTITLFVKYSLPIVLYVHLLVYGYYLCVTIIMFLLFLLLVSERTKQDSYLIGWVLIYPVYQQCLRYLAVIFILNEMIFKAHRDSSMAPWWVIRKTK